MKVKYSHTEGVFPFVEDDYVTIVVHYLYVNDSDEDLYYQGIITSIEEGGFWCVLDTDKTKEEHFSFSEIESVIPGDRRPFLNGTTGRIAKDYEGGTA